MLKNILRLLATSATFVAITLVANITLSNFNLVASQLGDSSTVNISAAVTQSVDLNIVSPFLNSHLSNSLPNGHSGCSCNVCLGNA